ncbi:MAG: amidohydrolase [Candidatus Hecatellales archaeon B24]|nr:MAG: amidohydrolase [Candidatus Hecatellales archaeon B24]
MRVDFHTHLGPSLSLGLQVSPEEILRQMAEAGVDRTVVFPFPSAAVADKAVNNWVLEEAGRRKVFYPFYYAPDDLAPPPEGKGFLGVKWHWVRGVSDCSSNYSVLEDPGLKGFVKAVASLRLPVIFEEEFNFTVRFVEKFPEVLLVVPHLGMLGGNPLSFLKAFKENENVCFDTSLASPQTIRAFIEEVGPERILFGSDIPFGHMKTELNKILSLELEPKALSLVTGGNALRLMGLAEK